MSSSHKRPRDKGSTGCADFASSNSTVTKFLGGTQKSWMTGRPMSNVSYPPRTVPPGLDLHESHFQHLSHPIESIPPIISALQNDADSVLPSPAPSDEVRQGFSDATDHSNGEFVGEGAAYDKRLSELAAKYGGVEEIEKRLRSVEHHPSPIAFDPPRPLLENLNEAHVSLSSVSPPVTPPSVPHLFTLPYVLSVLDAYGRSRAGQADAVELSRLALLRDACQSNDYTYLVLHQVYCYCSLSPNAASDLPELGPSQMAALVNLGSLILSNSILQPHAVKWFANFPSPIIYALSTSDEYRVAYRSVLQSLPQFAQNWQQFKELNRQLQNLPLVDDIEIVLGVVSTVLQRVIWTSIHRSFWTGTEDQCYRKAEVLFRENQCEFRSWIKRLRTNDRPPTTEETSSYKQNLSMRYQELQQEHAKHSQPQSPSHQLEEVRRVQQIDSHSSAPNSPMAPPPPYQDRVRQGANGVIVQSQGRPLSQTRSISAQSISGLRSRSSPLRVDTTDARRVHATSNSAAPLSSPSGFSPQPCAVPQNTQSARASPTVPFSTLSQGSPSFLHRSFQSHEGQQQQARQATVPQFMYSAPAPNRQGSSTIVPGFSSRAVGSVLPSSVHRQHISSPPNGTSLGRSPTQLIDPIVLPLLPPLGSVQRPSATQPNPASSALHQSHLRSPVFKAVRASREPDTRTKLYQYMKRIVLGPVLMHPEANAFGPLALSISGVDFLQLASDSTSKFGAPPIREVRAGSHIYRLRCARQAAMSFSESGWAVAEHMWPSNILFSINGSYIELRRKFHYGKDLPADLTPFLKEGANELHVWILRAPHEKESTFSFGVELIEIDSYERIRCRIPHREASDTVTQIKSSMIGKDPDVQVLDDLINIDLIDPYTARIYDVPARGKSCRHHQCFDLDTFLQTRKSKQLGAPTLPDEWKCPICGLDARPQSLVIEDFFLSVKSQLEKDGSLEAARAIVFEKDGTWHVNEEEENGENGDGKQIRERSNRGTPASTRRSTPMHQRRENEVIEIDDD